jgi:hypothetical protein
MESNLKLSRQMLAHYVAASAVLGAFFSLALLARAQDQSVPTQIPPKRSSQIHDGFGQNVNLPRYPYLPLNRWWWTRLADAGVKWVRIGQYEDSSDLTSWDWIEQKRGVDAAPPGLDDYVKWLVDNGIKIEIQLDYGNPMYTSPAGKLPDSIRPAPGFINYTPNRSLYSIFWPPITPDQITAFDRYVRWMVHHFKGRVEYWELWNEEDIGAWSPRPNPEQYGRLLKAFVAAVHDADPKAKVIYGGQASHSTVFARRALYACQCASGLDVFAYHTYPGFGTNVKPEAMDYRAFESPAKLRAMVRHYPGIRSDIQFWDNEFNAGLPSWKGSDESVQAKYIPRGMLYDLAHGVKNFIWEFVAATDGDEGDDFGLIHGLMYQPTDFTPRPAFSAFEHTDWLFSDTRFDPSIKIENPDILALRRQTRSPFFAYGFRSRTGKAIVAYWVGSHSLPGNVFSPLYSPLTVKNSGIEHPVLIDVVSGKIRPLIWEKGTADTVASVPVRDSVMVIADRDYFDWSVLPEAPSSLNAEASRGAVTLTWKVHGKHSTWVFVERRAGDQAWSRIAKLLPTASHYEDTSVPAVTVVSYRVRAMNNAGESAYSNVAHIERYRKGTGSRILKQTALGLPSRLSPTE